MLFLVMGKTNSKTQVRAFSGGTAGIINPSTYYRGRGHVHPVKKL